MLTFKTINGNHYVTTYTEVKQFDTLRDAWEFIFETKERLGK